jgi:hypothetical protein
VSRRQRTPNSRATLPSTNPTGAELGWTLHLWAKELLFTFYFQLLSVLP